MNRRPRFSRSAEPRKIRSQQARKQTLHLETLSALHDQHLAAGRQSQAGLHRPANDAGGPKPVREWAYHLHANRLDHAGHRGGRGGPATRRRHLRSGIPACRPANLCDESEERPGAHEAIRPAGHPFDFPETLRDKLERRGIQALRLDLETDRRQSDGRCARPPAQRDDRSREATRSRHVRGQRAVDRFSRLLAGLCRRLRRSAGRAGRSRSGAAGVRATAARIAASSSRRATPRSRRHGSPKPR